VQKSVPRGRRGFETLILAQLCPMLVSRSRPGLCSPSLRGRPLGRSHGPKHETRAHQPSSNWADSNIAAPGGALDPFEFRLRRNSGYCKGPNYEKLSRITQIVGQSLDLLAQRKRDSTHRNINPGGPWDRWITCSLFRSIWCQLWSHRVTSQPHGGDAMPRIPRMLIDGEPAVYHVISEAPPGYALGYIQRSLCSTSASNVFGGLLYFARSMEIHGDDTCMLTNMAVCY
jgi:hypothetical protein